MSQTKMCLPVVAFLLATAIISATNGTRIDEATKAAKEQLEKLKGEIGEKVAALQPEVHEKFEEAKNADQELGKTLATLRKLYLTMGKRMVEGHREMMRLPEINLKDEIEAFLEAFTVGNVKMEPALTFLDSSKKVVTEIFDFLRQRLGWMNFMLKTTMKPMFELFELNKFGAIPEIVTLFGKCQKLQQRGRILMEKFVDRQEIDKFELYAKHRYLLDIVNAAVDLQNELAKNSQAYVDRTMAARLGENFKEVQRKFARLQTDVRFLWGTFHSDRVPIDEDEAKKLASEDANIVEKFLKRKQNKKEESENEQNIFYAKEKADTELVKGFNNLSLMKEKAKQTINDNDNNNDEGENWEQLYKWESQVLVQVGHILMAYFGEEDKYLEKVQTLEEGTGSHRSGGVAQYALAAQKTESKDWINDLVEYMNDAPLLRGNGGSTQQQTKYPVGFVPLFLQDLKQQQISSSNAQTSTFITGLNIQALVIMHIAQIKKESDLAANKEVKTVKDMLKINKYNKYRPFIENVAKLRPIVWTTLVLHIGMQHWYMEKSAPTANKIKTLFNGLQQILKLYGLKTVLSPALAESLAKAGEDGHYQEVHILYHNLFGVHYDHAKPGIDHEWSLLVNVGRLLQFYYNDINEIDEKSVLGQQQQQQEGEKEGEASSSNVID